MSILTQIAKEGLGVLTLCGRIRTAAATPATTVHEAVSVRTKTNETPGSQRCQEHEKIKKAASSKYSQSKTMSKIDGILNIMTDLLRMLYLLHFLKLKKIFFNFKELG